MSADEDELVAEILGVLEELVEEEVLELASQRGLISLAKEILALLEHDPDANIGDWLLDRREVTELYAEQEALRERFGRVVARMGDDETPTKHNDALAAAIATAPDDTESWSVYADWLQEQGDPRGELMAIQIQRAKRTDDKRLVARERALLARYRRHFFGALLKETGTPGRDDLHDIRVQYSLRYGFLDEVTLSNHGDLRTLLGLESARFLRRLTVRCSLGALDDLLETATFPATLVRLELGCDRRHGGRLELGRLLGGLERLEVLVVRNCEVVYLPPVAAPKLRHLVVEATTLRIDDAALCSLPALERLEIHTDAIEGSHAIDRLLLEPPPGLTALALAGGLANARTVEALLAAPIARAVRHLDLRNNDLDDEDAALLLAQRGRLVQIETLDLRGNSFSSPIFEQLLALWPNKDDGQLYDENIVRPYGEDAESDDDDNDNDNDDDRYEHSTE